MKYERHNKILEIITDNEIETQDELIGRLKQSGYEVTQATVSRDIKELRLIKAATEHGTYKYVVSSPDDAQKDEQLKNDQRITAKYRKIIAETVIEVDCAQNLTVAKTLSGMAQAAAAALDGLEWQDIVGSIAGDDTILIVARDYSGAQAIERKFREIIGYDK